ncbi:hypothetical protein CesoFtcFv8_009575 [Champsocephalus esox]|uniref:Uncharacterized protein n=1 Tax=Champsocephalus esox TaxID=159716 RepID=A0AAN8CAC8_9TELE|nr:hypothetical protein CesoFtcFv8_009575 [Champsocephalus esox]
MTITSLVDNRTRNMRSWSLQKHKFLSTDSKEPRQTEEQRLTCYGNPDEQHNADSSFAPLHTSPADLCHHHRLEVK